MIGVDRDLARYLHSLGEGPTCQSCGTDADAEVLGEPYCQGCIDTGVIQ